MSDVTSADGPLPVVATLRGDDLRIVFRWLRLIQNVLGEPPDAVGDLVLLHAHLSEVARTMPRPDPDPLLTVSLRYGLRNGKPMSLQEVAVRLGYTQERIRQVENEVLRRLRYPQYWQSLRAGFYTKSGDSD